MNVHYSFLLRERNGHVHSVYERHDHGVFPEATWHRVLAARGFTVEVVVERTTDARTPRSFFVGHEPTAAPSQLP